jgi:hypothetical protein
MDNTFTQTRPNKSFNPQKKEIHPNFSPFTLNNIYFTPVKIHNIPHNYRIQINSW